MAQVEFFGLNQILFFEKPAVLFSEEPPPEMPADKVTRAVSENRRNQEERRKDEDIHFQDAETGQRARRKEQGIAREEKTDKETCFRKNNEANAIT
jgi:hypothetical protein